MLFKTRPYGWWSCLFLLFLIGALSTSLGELWKENCTDTSDITKVCNKDDDGGDNVGVMFQEEIAMFSNVGMNLEREKNWGGNFVPPWHRVKRNIWHCVTMQRCWECIASFRVLQSIWKDMILC